MTDKMTSLYQRLGGELGDFCRLGASLGDINLYQRLGVGLGDICLHKRLGLDKG